MSQPRRREDDQEAVELREPKPYDARVAEVITYARKLSVSEGISLETAIQVMQMAAYWLVND